jgi:hypothetical protein
LTSQAFSFRSLPVLSTNLHIQLHNNNNNNQNIINMSTFTNTKFLAAILAMATATSAHMTMQSPVPYGPKPNNSPLLADGSDFPCKVGPGGSYAVTTMNEWTVGADVTLTYDFGTATHGGGSCQISVTKDKSPTPQSVWKVIHSLEGGCVTTDPGNNGAINTIPFKVPAELPEGELTMAWTWFNKVGNRELYMNCAPINVSGGSGEGFDDLPDMAVANVGGPCTTTENFDYTFANPGKSVSKSGTGPYKELCGGAASTGGSSSPPPPAAASADTPKAPAAAAPAAPAAPAAQAPKAPSTGGSAGGSCSEEGAIVCSGEDMFGICSGGSAVFQPVAAGTKCSNGQIARRDYIHRSQRRAN